MLFCYLAMLCIFIVPSSASAVHCGAGSYNNGLFCTSCPSGTTSAAGSQSILSCICTAGLVRPVVTSYITTSDECRSSSARSPSQTVHAGFFRQDSTGIREDFCTIEIVSNASITVLYVPSQIDNRPFYNSICSFVHGTRRCTNTHTFAGSMSFISVTPAVSINLPGASQMVRIVYEVFTHSSDVRDFSLFWYAHGETFNCNAIPCNPGHVRTLSGCTACATGKYKP